MFNKVNDIKEYTAFIKDRVNESFFPHEKSAFYKGLKFLNLSVGKYLLMQIKGLGEGKLDSDNYPEIDILTLPQTPFAKKMLTKANNITTDGEAIMKSFFKTQLALSVISFEYFRKNFGKQVALEYAKYMIRSIDKMKSRIGSPMPKYVKTYYENMSREIALLESEIKNIKDNSPQSLALPQKTVHKIHFEDLGGAEFERLVYAFIAKVKTWDKTPEWHGQSGNDGGRDIIAILKGEMYCYLCANYQRLTFEKGKSDIDKLVKNKTIPTNLILVCGGSVAAKLRSKILAYSKSKGVRNSEIWSGVEFEEKLRNEAQDLVERFFQGKDGIIVTK